MVNDALELVYTLPRGDLKGGQRITEQRRKVPLIGATNVAFGGKTGTNHKVLCLSSAAVRCLDGPAASSVLKWASVTTLSNAVWLLMSRTLSQWSK